MPTIVTALTRHQRRTLQWNITHHYLNGWCYPFAEALHRLTGLPIVGFLKNDLPWHVGVRCPDGRVWDIRGKLSPEKFAEYYGVWPPIHLQEFTLEDLQKVRGVVSEREIASATRHILAIWPCLAPPPGSFGDRARQFADELEALSRKHGIWIRGPVPAQSPVLSEGDEAEQGYEVTTTEDGFGFTVERHFGKPYRERRHDNDPNEDP